MEWGLERGRVGVGWGLQGWSRGWQSCQWKGEEAGKIGLQSVSSNIAGWQQSELNLHIVHGRGPKRCADRVYEQEGSRTATCIGKHSMVPH